MHIIFPTQCHLFWLALHKNQTEKAYSLDSWQEVFSNMEYGLALYSVAWNPHGPLVILRNCILHGSHLMQMWKDYHRQRQKKQKNKKEKIVPAIDFQARWTLKATCDPIHSMKNRKDSVCCQLLFTEGPCQVTDLRGFWEGNLARFIVSHLVCMVPDFLLLSSAL